MLRSTKLFALAITFSLLTGTAWSQIAQSPAELVRSGDVASPASEYRPSSLHDPVPLPEAKTFHDPLVRTANFETPLLSTPPAGKSIPLAPRSANRDATQERPAANAPWQSLFTMGASLAFVLGLFLCLALLTRRGLTGRPARLPGEVIEVLGKAPHTKGQELQLVRLGGKLLLLCVTQHGSETLTEISDPAEVERLSAVCRRNHPGGASAAFDHMLANMGREPASGFAGDPRTSFTREGGRRA